jgi:UDP-N-acetylglucosamine/UDP-N-acetylgalactosamine diphosphorylase
MMVDLDRLKQRYEAANQSHVLAAIVDNGGTGDDVGDSDKEQEIRSFVEQLESIPVEKLAEYLETGRDHANSTKKVVPFPMDGHHDDKDQERRRRDEYREAGLQLIREGKVAAVILAGGQGTRLGFDGPKGCFDIGLPSHSTLFQLICARIKDLAMEAASEITVTGSTKATIPLAVMTAPHNDAETRAYFAQHDNFGLSSVQFCVQGMLPCMTDDDGEHHNNKIILESPTRVAMAPDGNGGIYRALYQDCTNLLDEVDYLHVFSIDNALVLPCDPVFVGYAHSHNCYIANKCVVKVDPHEKVGVMALSRSGNDNDNEPLSRPCVVEYSELSKEMAESVDETTGALLFGAANICNHLYRTDFIKNVILPAPPTFHLAHKCIPYWNNGTITTPSTNNGYKLEQFIFDAFALCPVERMKNFLVDRADEFAAVKNASGSDSPATALVALSNRNKARLRAAGAIVTGDGMCEIVYGAAVLSTSLRERFAGVEIQCPVVIGL